MPEQPILEYLIEIREFSLELDSSSSNVLTEEGTQLQYSSLSLIEYFIKRDLLVKTSFLIKSI